MYVGTAVGAVGLVVGLADGRTVVGRMVEGRTVDGRAVDGEKEGLAVVGEKVGEAVGRAVG